MKLSALLISLVAAEDRKVPPKTPEQRLANLKVLSTDILDLWFKDWVNKDKWENKMHKRLDAMGATYQRLKKKSGEKACGFYDSANPDADGGGGYTREEIKAILSKRKDADEIADFIDDKEDDERLNREDPFVGIRQVVTGVQKWSLRYLGKCINQEEEFSIMFNVEGWNSKLAKTYKRINRVRQ